VRLSEVRRYLAEGEFPEGSMGPKIRAAIEFLECGGEEVVITSLACLERALDGSNDTGTHVVPD
jgi:carbamate kinase